MSDEKLVTILNIVTSLQLPPPSLANTTTYYDDIPVRYTCTYMYVYTTNSPVEIMGGDYGWFVYSALLVERLFVDRVL